MTRKTFNEWRAGRVEYVQVGWRKCEGKGGAKSRVPVWRRQWLKEQYQLYRMHEQAR